MSRIRIIQLGLAAAAASILLVCPTAMATTSSVDEYIEHFPSGGKEQPSSELGSGGGKLSPAARQGLTSLGADGDAAAALAERGIPQKLAGGKQGAGRPGSGQPASRRSGQESDDGGSAIGNLIGEISSAGSGGLGPGLPIGLGVAALGAGLVLIGRRRGLHG